MTFENIPANKKIFYSISFLLVWCIWFIGYCFKYFSLLFLPKISILLVGIPFMKNTQNKNDATFFGQVQIHTQTKSNFGYIISNEEKTKLLYIRGKKQVPILFCSLLWVLWIDESQGTPHADRRCDIH